MMFWLLTAPFWLWVFFLAVMHLRDAHDDGLLVGKVKYPAYVVLAVGYAFDVFTQLTWGIAWFRELPPKQEKFPYFEPTISHRTKRWAAMPDDSFNRRTSISLRKHMLSRFDRTGGHS